MAEEAQLLKEMSTIRDWIRWSVTEFNLANLFYGHGTDNSWDEAVSLVLTTLHLPPDIHPKILNAKVTAQEKEKILRNARLRIQERVPVPYIVNEAWFAGFNFYVDKRVFVPRSPIAELVEEEFSPWVESQKVKRVLDLCTGSGCIAISTAVAFPKAKVDAVDLSQDALVVAQKNIERFQVQDRVRLIRSNLFEALGETRYDIIVSNPPYGSQLECAGLPPEYHHEPQLALLGGVDGLEVVQRLLANAHRHLNQGGILVVEVGAYQEQLEALYPSVPFTWLQFERGGEGVFLLTANELKEFQPLFLSKN